MAVKSEKKKEGLGIIWKSMLAYGIWFLLRNAFTKISLLTPMWVSLNDFVAKIYVGLSANTLKFLGYSTQYNARNILMGTGQEMYVGDHCLGIAASVIFVLIIFLLQGAWIHKFWFSLFGLVVIFLMNWFRVVGLAFMLKLGSPAFFQFNHKYTYLVMVYGLIFCLIVLFDKKISKY